MITYRCAGFKRGACDYEAPIRWTGPCPWCGRVYDIVQSGSEKREGEGSLAEIAAPPKSRMSTGMKSVDEVLNGGLVDGATVFLGGGPGSGKTSLSMLIGDGIVQGDVRRKVLFASNEMSNHDIGEYAHRIRVTSDRIIAMGNEGDVYKITDRAEKLHAALLIMDSLQVMFLDDCDASEGSSAQVMAVTDYVTAWAKRESTPVIIICQLSKDGDVAGPLRAQHNCDTILYLDKMPSEDDIKEDRPEIEWELRKLSVGKNRHGPSGLKAFFLINDSGMRAVPKKSKIITEGR